MTVSLSPGLDATALVALFLLFNREARVHAAKKFSWLRWCGASASVESSVELTEIVVQPATQDQAQAQAQAQAQVHLPALALAHPAVQAPVHPGVLAQDPPL